MRNAFSASQRSAGAVERGRRLRRDLFLFHGRRSQGTRQRAGHHLEQVNDGGELASIELIEELVRLLFFVCGCHPGIVYLYDGMNVIEDVDNAGNLLARYTQSGLIDEPLGMLRSGATSYYQADGLIAASATACHP